MFHSTKNNLKLCTILAFSLALSGFLAPCFAEEAQELPAQAYSGLVLELHVGASTQSSYGIYAEEMLLMGIGGALEGGFLFGYKNDRVIYGLGFNLSRFSISNETASDGEEPSYAATSFMFMPGLRIALYRTAEDRIELIGQMDFGLGATVFKIDGEYADENVFQFAYDFAPGVRYWVHPQFCLGAVAGLKGEVANFSDNTTHQMGMFALAQISGIF